MIVPKFHVIVYLANNFNSPVNVPYITLLNFHVVAYSLTYSITLDGKILKELVIDPKEIEWILKGQLLHIYGI